MVQAEGWYFIGRLRGRNRVRLKRNGRWIPAHNWYPRATAGAQDLGIGEYARSNPVPVRVVLARRAKKARHRLNMYGSKRRGRKSARNSRNSWPRGARIGKRFLYSHLDDASWMRLPAKSVNYFRGMRYRR